MIDDDASDFTLCVRGACKSANCLYHIPQNPLVGDTPLGYLLVVGRANPDGSECAETVEVQEAIVSASHRVHCLLGGLLRSRALRLCFMISGRW